jgi:hypothetical protein
MSFLKGLLKRNTVAPNYAISGGYETVVADIFSVLAPNLTSRNIADLATEKLTAPKQEAIISIWEKEAPRDNTSSPFYRATLWKHIQEQPTHLIQPILMALYFSYDTEDKIRQEILTKHGTIFKSMFDIFLKDSLPIGYSIVNIWEGLPFYIKNNLASKPETPIDLLYFIAQDTTLHSALAKNPSADKFIIDEIIKVNAANAYKALFERVPLTGKQLEQMWLNSKIYDMTFFLFFIEENTPSHLIKNFSFKDTQPSFDKAFFEEYFCDDYLSDKSALKLLSNIPLRLQHDLHTQVLVKIFESKSINVSEWVEYYDAHEEYGAIKEQLDNLKTFILKNLWDETQKDSTIAYFKEAYDVDIAGYSLDMVRSILNWED